MLTLGVLLQLSLAHILSLSLSDYIKLELSTQLALAPLSLPTRLLGKFQSSGKVA